MSSTSTKTKQKRCAYHPCSPRTTISTSYFSFPKDRQRALIWIKACNREDILDKDIEQLHKNYALCEKHFEDKYVSKGGTRKTLFAHAVPTLFNHVNPQDKGSTTTCASVTVLADGIVPPSEISLSGPDMLKGTAQSNTDVTTTSPLVPISVSIDSLPGTSGLIDLLESPSTSTHLSATPEISHDLLLSPSVGIQTTSTLSYGTPRKRKLRRTVRNLKKKCEKNLQEKKKWGITDFNEMLDTYLSPPLARIIKEQARLKHRKPIGRRYSGELKQFALTLYFLGPRAYSFMSKFLYLPTERTLQKLTQKLVCNPGLSSNAIYEALKIKVSKMLELDKHCAIVIDEMSIKKNLFYNTSSDELVGLLDIGEGEREFCFAGNALVIMVRGLYANWKQPLAYFFLKSQFAASQLGPAIEKCVEKLTENAFTYVCGYLLKKALDVHRCHICEKFSKECEELDATHLLTYFKAYDSNKSIYGGLRTPNETFINYVYKLENMFVLEFDRICLSSGLSHLFFNVMKEIPLIHPCPNFLRVYVLKLFIRLRLFYSLKYANAEIKAGKGEKANRKIKILSHI